MPPAEASRPRARAAPAHDLGVVVRLPRSPRAAHGARQAVRERFGDLLARDTLDDALLVVSELVTNAVLHGQGDIELHLDFDGQRVSGEVRDEGVGCAQQLRERRLDDGGGRGLGLVGQIADSWGLHEGPNHVWFQILAQRPL